MSSWISEKWTVPLALPLTTAELHLCYTLSLNQESSGGRKRNKLLTTNYEYVKNFLVGGNKTPHMTKAGLMMRYYFDIEIWMLATHMPHASLMRKDVL